MRENHIDNFIFCCEAAGESLVSHNVPASPRVQWLIIVDRGSIEALVDNEKYRAEGPCVVNISVNCLIRSVHTSRNFHGYFVGVQMSLLLDIMRHRNPFPADFRANFRRFTATPEMSQERLKIILQDTKNLLGALGNKQHRFAQELNYAQLYILLTDLADMAWQRHGAGDPQHSYFQTSADRILGEFFKTLNEHIHTESSVGFYAERLFISKQYLSEVVRAKTGRSVGEIISMMRYEIAVRYLNDPSLSIQQVADQLNFPDQSTFGKFFKRHSGVSPINYRKNIRSSLLSSRQVSKELFKTDNQ